MSFIKKNLAEIAPHFTMTRMINDYYERFYSKLFEQGKKIKANNYKLAVEMKSWKKFIMDKWPGVEVKSLLLPDTANKPLNLGEKFEVELKIFTNGISPEEIGIDLVLGQKVMDEVREIYRLESLDLKNKENGESIYTCTINLTESGVFDYAFRLYPKNNKLPHRLDFPLVKWI
jgi:hypothetical protein